MMSSFLGGPQIHYTLVDYIEWRLVLNHLRLKQRDLISRWAYRPLMGHALNP